MTPLNIAILKVSDTRTEETDTAGQLLSDLVTQTGHTMVEKIIVKDDKYQIRAAISNWLIQENIDVIISTGGTGITGRDGTPEAVLPLLDKVIEGFGELFRAEGFKKIGTSAIQSRAIAGVANAKYIFCLPGSKGACKDGWALIEPQLNSETKPCNLALLRARLDE